jgi:hypothetical protein
MFVVMLAGWVNEQHRAVYAYLKEENRVLRELHGRKRHCQLEEINLH